MKIPNKMMTFLQNRVPLELSFKRHWRYILFLGLMGIYQIALSNNAINQAEKNRTRISVVTTQLNTGELKITGILKARIGRSYLNMTGFPLSFYTVKEEEELLIGQELTDENGEAIITVMESDINPDTSGAIHYLIRFDGSDTLSSSENDATIYRGRIDVNTFEEDSIYYFDLQTIQIKGEENIPVEDVDVRLYVRGLFSNLLVGEGTSDESGELQIEFPRDFPGDLDGMINLMVRVEEHELFGNMEASIEKAWGVPIQSTELEHRTLWSPDPPIWMVLTFIVMISAVWSHYIVIVWKLFKIKKSSFY